MSTDDSSFTNTRRSDAASWPTAAKPNGTMAATDRILVVDDDPDIRDIVARLLREASYRVGTAEDGESAWAALSADPFDLVITDHNMPRLTGLELLRRVRADPRNLPVIMISGNLSAQDHAQLCELRPGAVLEKPFSFHALLSHVRELLRGTPARATGRTQAGLSLDFGSAT